MKTIAILLSCLLFPIIIQAAPLVFEGTNGPGKGKHIVFIAGDHEYRSEETLPAIARIMAKHHGFKCTVLFNLEKDGTIAAGSPSTIPGMEALASADLAVLFLRFQNLPDEQMKHLDDYLKRGGPVIGLRTSTHAFKINAKQTFARYSYDYKGNDYTKGFGHQILGQTWVGHYGSNHKQSTRITIATDQESHPILRGVKDIWVQAGGYVGKPTDGEVLTMAQPLNGMTPDSPADEKKRPMPSEWTRSYKTADGKTARVFTTLYGASADITNEGYRRMLVNAHFWALGMEQSITEQLNVSLVGPYKPNKFTFNGHARGIKPEAYSGFTSPIPANNNTQSTQNKAIPAGKALAEVPADYKDPLPFTFKKNDTIAILGNALPDRMQHDAWMETLLQSELKNQSIRFRTMSISGDRPTSFPRSSGQMSMTDYLRHVKPNVVFAFFGYNESYENKPENYKKNLLDFIKNTRAAKPNGTDFPRIVLFSPIAREDTGNPNLSDGKSHNVILAAYTKATQEAAIEAGVAFIDIYHPSLELYKDAESPLTINGVHLSAEGNRLLAEVIAKALLNKSITASPSLEDLRQAVLDKNIHWYNRYHASNGNDIWGGRSKLSFVNGQTNAEVLQHELIMLDIMTANRDQRIWARSVGKDLKIDDSNVPKPIPVISNVGGGSKSSSAEKEGRTNYLSAEEAIKDFALAKGFKIELYADESRFPELVNPVQMQVDAKGRLWVACWPDYPKLEPGKPVRDSLLILEDDGNGKAKSAKVFAQTQNPLGFEFWNNGVLVTRQSELLHIKDTNGDDRADTETIMLTGLDTADTHHGANNLIYGPDGGIYWQSGVFMQHNHEHPWGSSLQTTASAMYRFDPRRFSIAVHAGNSPNPHGTSFDYWGYCFATDGTGGRAYQVRPEGNSFKMHELLKKEVRPVTASTVVSSSHFPDDMQGDFLICNVIGFLGLKHYDLARDAAKGTVWGTPAGDELTAKTTNADGSQTEQQARGFLISGDKNFRPSGAVFGPDGSLYISDWHNVIIGHMQHNVRDPNRDHKHGRIYRITAIDRPLQKIIPIAGQPIAALLENLKSPIDGIRHRTRIELSGRDSEQVIAETQKWIKQFKPDNKEHAHHLLEALWLHQQHNVRNLPLLEQLLASPEPHARNAAKVVQHLWLKVEANTQGGIIADAPEEKIKVTIPAHLAKSDHATYQLGAEVFHREAHCVTCHQANGEGLANVYPPLNGTPWVTGSEERLIKIALNGLWGKIHVNGKEFDTAKGVPPMTAFGSLLDDKELAAVLTYVRNSWGNKAPIVTPQSVQRVRQYNKARTTFWTPEELLKAHPLEK